MRELPTPTLPLLELTLFIWPAALRQPWRRWQGIWRKPGKC